ncbi:MAG TPA: winged helix-turn-helix domain-containing protein, partial [Stellaceae bacterium]|nr:winged helix-turn-helix domain-containing protein [Stellaceae bacterium]
MKDGPVIAGIAALIGDPARANMLASLMDGRALTVSELAESAGVALPTASGHLSRLADAGLVAARRQGRHRYFALTGGDVAHALEALMALAQRTGAVRTRTGPRGAALRTARICYDHMAGRIGVELLDAARARGLLAGTDTPTLTPEGARVFAGLGIDTGALA